MSSVGGSAKILTIPNAPISVAELYSSRTATSLGLQWTIGGYGPTKDGGSPVIDYQVTYTTGSTSVVVPNILVTQFTATGLTTGSNYVFFVQARNEFGLSISSQLTYMYCSFVPARPDAPTTSVLGNKVVISWTAPNNNGAEIDRYSVQIRQSDGQFTPDLANCDGGDAGIRGLRTCTVPILTLRATPYNLVLGDDVVVQLNAHNYYGDSDMSLTGSGAKIVYPPDAPTQLSDVPSITNAF